MAFEPVKIADYMRFGENFELDLRAYELRCAGRVLKLERIPMELLLLLIEERGQLVSRDEIVERIWGKGVFLDTDNSINAAIRKIRQVLKDEPEQPRFVQTITGRGYRFIAAVVEAKREISGRDVGLELAALRDRFLEKPVKQVETRPMNLPVPRRLRGAGERNGCRQIGDLWAQGRLIRRDRVLWLAVLGNTYFWFLGALLTANIVFYCSDVLHISSTRTGILQAGVAIGIGLGSLAAGYLSGGKVEYGLIPLGSVGMTVFGVLLSRQNLSFTHVLVPLAALGFSAGFFAVPVNALIQHRPDEKDKGGVIAAANLLSFVGIGGAAGVYYVLQHYSHFSPPAIFLSASLLTVAATVYVLYLLPDALLRLLVWIATHTLYRIHLV